MLLQNFNPSSGGRLQTAFLGCLVILLAAGTVGAANAQTVWNQVATWNPTVGVPGLQTQGHGIAVDAQGKVWYQPFYASEAIPWAFASPPATTVNTRSLYVFNPDGSSASFSPLVYIDLPGGARDTLGGRTILNWEGAKFFDAHTGRGLRADENGNILVAQFDRLYRLNHANGAGMNKVIVPGGKSNAAPAVAKDNGLIFVAPVVPGTPMFMYDSDFNALGNALDRTVGFSRSFEVSKDGNRVYWGAWDKHGVFLFQRADEFSAFDSVGVVIPGVDAESFTWQPGTGWLWVSAGSSNDGPNRFPDVTTNWAVDTWYAFDPAELAVNTVPSPKAMLTWTPNPTCAADRNATNCGRPRGLAFSPDGQIAYVTTFAVNAEPAIQVFTAGPYVPPPPPPPPPPPSPLFDLSFRATNALLKTSTVGLGLKSGASSGFDSQFDIYAPPPPPAGAFDLRITSIAEALMKDYRGLVDLPATWTLQIMAGDGGQPVTLTWNPATLPAAGRMELLTISGTRLVADMRQISTFDIPDLQFVDGIATLQIRFSLTETFERTVQAGWNMVGLPVDVGDPNYSTLFPSALANTFYGFSGAYLVPSPARFTAGKGYWLRFPTATTRALDGLPIRQLTLNLVAGWNMISPPSCSVPIGSIQDSGSILIPNTAYGFAQAYAPVTQFEPAHGYWIRAATGGQVTLPCSAGKGPSELPIAPADFTQIVLRGADMAAQSLYVGNRLPHGTHALAYTLPPEAPGQRWQARFADGRMVAELHDAIIPLSPDAIPLDVFQNGAEAALTLEVIGPSSAVLARSPLQTGRPVRIVDTRAIALRLRAGDPLPTDFVIEPAYPNPFNPTTTLRFSLPEAGPVRLDVFDAIGRRVATLLDSDAMPAGWHDYQWNARGLSSGLYTVRLATPRHRLHRSLVLSK